MTDENRLPHDAIDAGLRDREIKLLIGCERCGRRISEINKGRTCDVAGVAMIEGEFYCQSCHAEWLKMLLLPPDTK